MVNNLSMRDVGSILDWEDPLEEGMATHSSIVAKRIPWTEEPGYSPWGHKESDMPAWSDSACMHKNKVTYFI